MPRARLLIWASLFSTLSCADAITAPRPSDVRLRAEWLSGAAAANWDQSTGRFRLSMDPHRFVLLQDAAAWSTAYVQLLADSANAFNARDVPEHDRGGPITFGSLQPCARQVYVTSPFGFIPEALPAFIRRAYANAWAVTLCGADGTAQVAVGVADDSTSLRVVNGTLVADTTEDLSQFSVAGIPSRYPQGLPISPELAVQTSVLASGRRVVEVPVAYNQYDDRFIGNLPFCASWRVTLDQPVAAQGLTTGTRYKTSEYYVRNSGACFSDKPQLYLPLGQQPGSRWITISSRGDSALVQVQGPVSFEPVTLTP